MVHSRRVLYFLHKKAKGHTIVLFCLDDMNEKINNREKCYFHGTIYKKKVFIMHEAFEHVSMLFRSMFFFLSFIVLQFYKLDIYFIFNPGSHGWFTSNCSRCKSLPFVMRLFRWHWMLLKSSEALVLIQIYEQQKNHNNHDHNDDAAKGANQHSFVL